LFITYAKVMRRSTSITARTGRPQSVRAQARDAQSEGCGFDVASKLRNLLPNQQIAKPVVKRARIVKKRSSLVTRIGNRVRRGNPSTPTPANKRSARSSKTHSRE
jgi:hypothetical protein